MAILLTSTLLAREGFAHGFSLRTGGVSEGPYASLNLGRGLGDDPEAVAENHRRFAAAIGASRGLFEVSQVHGRRVRFIGPGERPERVRAEEADALATVTAGVALGVRTADCVPILLADPRGGAVAAVHAGWRGAVAGVLLASVAALAEQAGVDATGLLVAIGPHIRRESFEIGEDVARALERAAPGAPVVDRGGERPHGDLAALVRWQLRQAGVPDAQVEDVGGDTAAEPLRFFSHRRDRGDTGRHVAAILAR